MGGGEVSKSRCNWFGLRRAVCWRARIGIFGPEWIAAGQTGELSDLGLD